MIDFDYLQKITTDALYISSRAAFALMHPTDRLILHHIAKNLPNNATVVEVGGFCGGSAAIMSNACPTAKIYSLDIFDNTVKVSATGKARDDIFASALGENVPWTVDAVQASMIDYPNVKFFKGCSPYDFQDWDIELDLYHEDGNHTLPAVLDNMKFWGNKVKPGGLILCHDYRPFLPMGSPLKCPDVEFTVDQLVNSGRVKFIMRAGQFAVLEKLEGELVW